MPLLTDSPVVAVNYGDECLKLVKVDENDAESDHSCNGIDKSDELLESLDGFFLLEFGFSDVLILQPFEEDGDDFVQDGFTVLEALFIFSLLYLNMSK